MRQPLPGRPTTPINRTLPPGWRAGACTGHAGILDVAKPRFSVGACVPLCIRCSLGTGSFDLRKLYHGFGLFGQPFSTQRSLIQWLGSEHGFCVQPLQGWVQGLQGSVQELQGCADDCPQAAWLGELPRCGGCHCPRFIHQRWADNQQAHGQHGRNGGPLVRLSAWVDALAVLVRPQRMPPAGFTSKPFRPIISENPATLPFRVAVGSAGVGSGAAFPALDTSGFFTSHPATSASG
jgi:hypothetical protein